MNPVVKQIDKRVLFLEDDQKFVIKPTDGYFAYKPHKSARTIIELLSNQPSKMEGGIRSFEKVSILRILSRLGVRDFEFVYDKTDLRYQKEVEDLFKQLREIGRVFKSKRIPLRIKHDDDDIWLIELPEVLKKANK
jgi:hypothetical protein